MLIPVNRNGCPSSKNWVPLLLMNPPEAAWAAIAGIVSAASTMMHANKALHGRFRWEARFEPWGGVAGSRARRETILKKRNRSRVALRAQLQDEPGDRMYCLAFGWEQMLRVGSGRHTFL